MLIPEVSS
jgi:hypothetical protein